MVRITCYDGVGCIGGNKILLEDDERGSLWLDFGTNFGRQSRYYEEYLKPKSAAGLYEPLRLGLLPRLRGLYREDLVCQLHDPWTELPHEPGPPAQGVLLSHAHKDHLGAVHFLREDLPLYASPATAAIAKALQDTGDDEDLCYTIRRQPGASGALEKSHWNREPSLARPYALTKGPSAAFESFWGETPGGRRHVARPLATLNRCCGAFPVRAYPVDHSVYGALAWAVETSAGWVVYSGDLRCHGGAGDRTWDWAAAAAALEPAALIMEGTRIGTEASETEADVAARARPLVARAEGLVVADFGPRHVERLITFLRLAEESGRYLAILPKDVYLLDALRVALGDDAVPPLDGRFRIYHKLQATEGKWQRELRDRYASLAGGCGPGFVEAADIRGAQDRFVCCFSFWDVNELAYLSPAPGSVWIYSTNEPYSAEQKIDLERLRNWLQDLGLTFHGDPALGDPALHVSGHAPRGDLLALARAIRPRALIPIHTKEPQAFAQELDGEIDVRPPRQGVPAPLP
ncbi:MAG: exonuclease [Armatimonadetes bacterium]|nr:exonuclease [Armatimonadota bacterium]